MFQTNVEDETKIHILYSVTFFENRAFCEIRWKNVTEPGRPQMTKWLMLIACWITKVTNINSEYAILIAFPRKR